MKTKLLIIFLLAGFFSASAQYFTEPGKNLDDKMERIAKNGNEKSISSWFNYGYDCRYDQGADVSYFRYHMFPDSTVVVEFSNGMGPVWVHGVGQVLDPYSAMWSLTGNGGPLLNTDAYSVDSIALFYRYFRYQNTNPDTVHLQFYKHSSMTYNPTGWSNDGRSNARIQYNYISNKGLGNYAEIKHLLAASDTAMFAQRYIQLATSNFTANPGEVVAMTAIYKNGNPTNPGDTIDPYMNPQPFTKRNTFILYQYRDNDKQIDQGYYNHGQMLITSVRNNNNQQGWNGQFIPGLAYQSGFYHLDVAFKITSVVGMPEKAVWGLKTQVYPNPVEKTAANVALELENNEQVLISVLDITGKTVAHVLNRNLQAGKHVTAIDLSGFQSGVYFVKIQAESQTQVIKINVL